MHPHMISQGKFSFVDVEEHIDWELHRYHAQSLLHNLYTSGLREACA